MIIYLASLRRARVGLRLMAYRRGVRVARARVRTRVVGAYAMGGWTAGARTLTRSPVCTQHAPGLCRRSEAAGAAREGGRTLLGCRVAAAHGAGLCSPDFPAGKLACA